MGGGGGGGGERRDGEGPAEAAAAYRRMGTAHCGAAVNGSGASLGEQRCHIAAIAAAGGGAGRIVGLVYQKKDHEVIS